MRASDFLTNRNVNPNCSGLFTEAEYRSVREFFDSSSNAKSTPLRHLSSLASHLGMADILVKDESARWGLKSFKVLGVSYAVHRLLQAGKITAESVLVCSSEGNHGRAVSRVAAEIGLAARIYVAEDTSPSRIHAIRQEGAEVILVDGTYDDATRLAI